MSDIRNFKPPKITAKVIEDNVIHVSYVVESRDGFYEYERIFYLDFNKVTDVENSIFFDRDAFGRLTEEEQTVLKLTFKNIPISRLTRWEKGKKDSNKQ